MSDSVKVKPHPITFDQGFRGRIKPEIPFTVFNLRCDICGAGYFDSQMLTIHMEVHKNKPDNINPDHYKAGGMEVIDILRAKLTPEQFEGFLMGNVIKYTFRCKMKNGAEDLKKAAWYSSMLAGKDPRQSDAK